MRLNQFRYVVLPVGAAALIFGCAATLPPVQNLESRPILANKPSVTLDEVGNAIVRAGVSLNMTMQKVTPGLLTATYVPIGGTARGQSAVMEIKFDTRQYGITYRESRGLGYDGTGIHRAYNTWVQRLDQRIRAQLSAL